MELPRDWQEFLSSLNARKVKYLVVGAHALAAHGVPRYTADLDVWVANDPANARRVLAALDDFGFSGLTGLGVEDFENPEMVVMLGRPPLRIDLLTSISGCAFEAAWKRRLRATLGGERVGVLSREDLVANKRAAGRPKDLLDLELLRGLPKSKNKR
ncbi:MAG: nucleotidyltransferase [Myxococcota bacterium]|jgi:hypothetical protein